MKKIIITLLFLFVSFNVKAQNQNIPFEDKVIKVKLVKSISYDACDKKDSKKNAVILEFDVLLPEDKKIFGDKIYAATICNDFPGEGVFDRTYDWDLQLYESKYYQWEILILNKDLFEKNINRKKYWVKDIRRKHTIYCGLAKQ
ncbi:hypothetical protein [Flavobacterium frigoris]|uniref:Uncharacterized protein n=1 Tax=Flavobacterium frigoris (strain PS1) TaxID=1086011 RepID=H7FUT1_FLAFP|nr:hypothetical protein [Flavobacterium frigoris]EIA07770.1 hypothetical protein HJ01_02929 [Flavobacterium frigoris PS1]